MFPLKIRMDLQALLFVFLLSLVCAQDRKIFPVLNPDCKSCTANDTLVYVRADGSQDTIHQIWDFTRKMPTIIYAITKPKTSMHIAWNGKDPDISLSDDPLYCFGIVINKLYEYDDCHDSGHINITCPKRPIPMHHVTWTLKESTLTEREAMVRLHGIYRQPRGPNRGIIDIKLDLLPFKDYAVELPHLIHTVNSTLIDVSLVNFTTFLNASRLAAHIILTSADDKNDTMRYTMRKSLDDEHTPGVFEIIEILTPQARAAAAGAAGGFMQLRPVAYTEPTRSVSSSTIAYVSQFNKTSVADDSTLARFYRRVWRAAPLSQDIYLSFGLPGDGYYRQHNYTSWSFTYGYGQPPIESVSLFVIIIIAVGLGVPLLLALSGVAVVLVRRHRQRNAPERFIDDE